MNQYQRLSYHLARDACRIGGVHFWLAFRILPGLVLIALSLLLLASAGARAGLQEGVGADLNGLESGHMLLRNEITGVYTPALMHSSKVHFDISGMIATVTVEQSFRNVTGHWVEGVYGFPLPDAAAVRHLEMVIGERRIIGEVREKGVARKLYKEAKQAGKKASLMEQQRPNLFTNRVANIGPGEDILVRLEYVQQVEFVAGEFSLRFPTTITPRYMPGREASPPGSEQVPLNPITITARLDMGMPLAQVQAPYHEIALSRQAEVYDIRLANGISEMDRDFVLNWQPVTGSAPVAALFGEQVDDEHFGLLMVVPPLAGRAIKTIPREIVFVVDTSGSMGGVSIEQARQSVARALQQLRPEDRFNIVEFNSVHRALYRQPVVASRHHIQQAQDFVSHLRASGGTEMLPALRAALEPGLDRAAENESSVLRQVIFITDGAVGNEVVLFKEISARLGHSRLFTVGIGSAPNSWFMREAAQFGRGTHTHIGSLDEVGERMADLFDKLSRPVAINLSVSWPGRVEAWPERMPDLYQGQPLLVAVSFGNSAPSGEVVVNGELNGLHWSKRLQLGSGVEPQMAGWHKGVASLFGRKKIAGLLDQIVLGRSEELVRADVLPVALQHRLLSPYTSFVAVEQVVSRPAGEAVESKAVVNARPRGQSGQNFAYPRTATTGPAQAWLGALLLFLALIVYVLRQPELDHAATVGT